MTVKPAIQDQVYFELCANFSFQSFEKLFYAIYLPITFLHSCAVPNVCPPVRLYFTLFSASKGMMKGSCSRLKLCGAHCQAILIPAERDGHSFFAPHLSSLQNLPLFLLHCSPISNMKLKAVVLLSLHFVRC